MLFFGELGLNQCCEPKTSSSIANHSDTSIRPTEILYHISAHSYLSEQGVITAMLRFQFRATNMAWNIDHWAYKGASSMF